MESLCPSPSCITQKPRTEIVAAKIATTRRKSTPPRRGDQPPLGRLVHPIRCLSLITRAFLEGLEALLWGFHNPRTGCCFPSYETIAAKAGCARGERPSPAFRSRARRPQIVRARFSSPAFAFATMPWKYPPGRCPEMLRRLGRHDGDRDRRLLAAHGEAGLAPEGFRDAESPRRKSAASTTSGQVGSESADRTSAAAPASPARRATASAPCRRSGRLRRPVSGGLAGRSGVHGSGTALPAGALHSS